MNELFEGISKKNKAKLLKELEASTFTFKKNTDLLKTLSDHNVIGVIDYGSVQIIRNDYHGNRIIIDDLEKNELLGSILYPISKKECSIVTKEETKIILIDSNQILNRTINYHYYYQFIQNLLKIIFEKINEQNERIEILTKKTTRDKLLEYFKIISKKRKTKIIYLPFTFTELADYLAVDRSAMSRELKYLKEDGFIEVSNRKITLLY